MEPIFPNYPESSRVWIFQGDRPLSPADHEFAETTLHSFISNWKSHGNPMVASFKILYNQFVVIALNTASGHEASGCGIDGLVKVMKVIGEKTKIDFLNNANIAFLKNQNIYIIKHTQLKNEIEKGVINQDDKVFINSITSLSEVNKKWLVPVNESWISKYFKTKILQEKQ